MPSAVPILTTLPSFLQPAAPASALEAICTSPGRRSLRSRLALKRLLPLTIVLGRDEAPVGTPTWLTWGRGKPRVLGISSACAKVRWLDGRCPWGGRLY